MSPRRVPTSDVLSARQSGPAGTFETLPAGNFDAITAIEVWDSVLTGRDDEELEQDDVPHIVAGEAPFVIGASAALRQARVANGTGSRGDSQQLNIEYDENCMMQCQNRRKAARGRS